MQNQQKAIRSDEKPQKSDIATFRSKKISYAPHRRLKITWRLSFNGAYRLRRLARRLFVEIKYQGKSVVGRFQAYDLFFCRPENDGMLHGTLFPKVKVW